MASPPIPRKVSPELLQALHRIKSLRHYPKGATLFQQGSVSGGIYLVLSGEVRVLLPNGPREEQLLQVMGPGTMLGLSESMTGEKHRTRAEAGDKTTVGFVPRQEFRAFLVKHEEFCVQVAESLSDELHGIYHKFRSITAHPGRPRHRLLDEQLN
jgi:CRP/FNR family cyclic AMP-dependent transcriptional regulator